MTKKIQIEVCCGSIDDALEAEAGGADRIELNSAIFLGGLTPSAGEILEVKKRTSVPVISMIRPRGAGFCYTDAEFEVMKQDLDFALEAGVEGIVFGILTPEGRIDMNRSEELIEAVRKRKPEKPSAEVVFHRAFDVVPDMSEALEQLVELGVDRVLTTGGKPEVNQAEGTIKDLVEQAAGRIQILPGAPRLDSLPEFVEKVGCTQVHIAPFSTSIDASTRNRPSIYFGGAVYPPEDRYDGVDRERLIAYRGVLE